jgi:hypothetical protein
MLDENINLTIEAISLIEKRILTNKETEDDYRTLDTYLSSTGVGKEYLLEKFRENNIPSYGDFVFEKLNTKNRVVEGILMGYVKGVIQFLKDFIKKK